MKIYVVEGRSGDEYLDTWIVEVFTDESLAKEFLSLVSQEAKEYSSKSIIEQSKMFGDLCYDPYKHGVDLEYHMYTLETTDKVEKKVHHSLNKVK